MTKHNAPGDPGRSAIPLFRRIVEGVAASSLATLLIGLVTGLVAGFTTTTFIRAVREAFSYHEGWYSDCAIWLFVPGIVAII